MMKLKELKKKLQGAKKDTDQYATAFMNAADQVKEAYVKLEAGHIYHYKRTITLMLHRYNPGFLELDARWVDALLEVEWDMKD